MKAVSLPVALLASVMFLYGCDSVQEWEEEVRLHDGRVIVVKRTAVNKRPILDWQNPVHGTPKEMMLRLAEPIRVEWRGAIAPIALDVSGTDVIVVIKLGGGGECASYGNPNPPFVYFRSRNGGKWERVGPAEVPPGMRQNLLVNPWKSEIEQLRGPLKAEGKEKLNFGVPREIREFAPKDTRRQALC